MAVLVRAREGGDGRRGRNDVEGRLKRIRSGRGLGGGGDS